MLKRIGWLALLVSIAMMPFAGCGSDDTVTPKPGPDVEVRNGTWSLTFHSYWTGPDSCAARGDTTITLPDTLLCSLDLVGQDTFEFDCTSSIEGEDVAFDCTAVIRDIDPCQQVGHITGTGTVTDTTIALTISVWASIEGRDEICSIYLGTVDACRLVEEVSGEWISDEDAENCPEDDLTSAFVVRELMSRVAARSFPGY